MDGWMDGWMLSTGREGASFQAPVNIGFQALHVSESESFAVVSMMTRGEGSI
jgi:hypothetical protein